jgi:hypothetical protein
MLSKCSATIYDPHWDQHLRILVFVAVAKAHGAFVRKATLPLFNALEKDDCTTIPAAKALSADAGCLEVVDAKLRSIFVRLVSEAEPTGTQRPAAPVRFRAATSNRQVIPHHL